MAGSADTGAIDAERTSRHRRLASIVRQTLDARGGAPKVKRVQVDGRTLRIGGSGFSASTLVHVGGTVYEPLRLSPGVLTIPVPRSFKEDTKVVLTSGSMAPTYPEEKGSELSLTEVMSPGVPLRTDRPFPLRIQFQSDGKVPARLLEVQVRFPDGHRTSQLYPISPQENDAGEKTLDGFRVERGGELEVMVSLYDDRGNADYLERIFDVVPSNPLQLYVYPVHGLPSGSGAAEYRGSESRYYCEGRWVISNGEDFPVTVGPEVHCRVSDASLGELADFTFDIAPQTVQANSNATLYVHTRHGSSSDVYDLFRTFGDARYDFWLETSTGSSLSDWNVWVAMAQVGVTANFVGSFSWDEQLKVVDLIDTTATSIYSQVDCFFTGATPILVIPSSDSDWSRYRDIRVEQSKGNCTDSDEADDLRDDWSSPSEFDKRIDIFFVESFSGDACASSLGGFSPVDGPTGKGGSDSGIVIDVKDLNILTSLFNAQVFGIIVAHEVGHYLGLDHSTGGNNFMNATVGTGNTGITYGQWKEMRDHDFVRRLNP